MWNQYKNISEEEKESKNMVEIVKIKNKIGYQLMQKIKNST